MQAVHELGHVLGAWATGARVTQVVLTPTTVSRTDVADNSRPLIVVWSGPIVGVGLPVLFWSVAQVARLPGAFVLRFFAGFCFVANGLYIGLGSFGRIGDCGEMLRHGSAIWQLWLFGAVTVPIGLALWHRQGQSFGLGAANGKVSHAAAYGTLGVCATLVVIGLLVGGE
jgi:hypothetical protein